MRLPEDLCSDAEAWLEGRFDSLESLLAFLLQQAIKDDGAKLDQEEEDMVQQRLKDLGYI